ncbi:MAG: DUF3131 domain-containing protein [Pseudomonadota bacterium]
MQCAFRQQDVAPTKLGLVSAYRLGVIGEETFSFRLRSVLEALEKIPLFDEKLPNKVYDTRSLQMVDYANQADSRGIGWSAIDIARLMVPLNVIIWNYPEYGADIKRVVDRWDMHAMIQNGVMIGSRVDDLKNTELVQEGRIGYEEYAARALALLGYDINIAAQYEDHLNFIEIEGIEIPIDNRDPHIYDAHNYVVSESYILQGIEFGLDHLTEEFAYRVFLAQQNRYQRTQIPTAVSEDNIDRPPYFVYNTVFSDGKEWNAITDTGADASAHRSVSTKAAFGWKHLFDTAYGDFVFDVIEPLHDPDKGWYSGLYEADRTPNKAITANTNAIILETLHYKQFGPMISINDQSKRNAEVFQFPYYEVYL